MTWSLVIYGAARTKKNHGSVIVRGGRKFHIPSAAWTRWVAECQMVYTPDYTEGLLVASGGIAVPLNVTALFYRDRATGDAVGYYQGLADLLERRGIVANDRYLVSWDGSRLLKDAQNPRVELTLTPIDR